MNDPREQLWQVQEQRNKFGQQLKEDKFKESSRRRLAKSLETKMRTSFIGALAKFEMAFGHLWGHGGDSEELSESELEFRQIWQQCRTDILNNGNTQLRGMQSEILEYTVSWNRHQLNFSMKDSHDSEQKEI